MYYGGVFADDRRQRCRSINVPNEAREQLHAEKSGGLLQDFQSKTRSPGRRSEGQYASCPADASWIAEFEIREYIKQTRAGT